MFPIIAAIRYSPNYPPNNFQLYFAVQSDQSVSWTAMPLTEE